MTKVISSRKFTVRTCPIAIRRTILKKAGADSISDSLTDIADSSNVYDLKNIYSDHPDYRRFVGEGEEGK